MLAFLVLLLLIGGGVYLFATENPGTLSLNLLQYHWEGVPAWVLVAGTALAIVILWMLVWIIQSALHGAHLGSQRRRIAAHESTIARLREENALLRTELQKRAPALVHEEARQEALPPVPVG